MSATQILSPEAQLLKNLENVKIRDRVPMPQSVYLQIERCNMSISNIDESIFEANVRALLAMLPITKKDEVLRRSGDYNKDITGWTYESACGHNIGNPENPVTWDDKPPKRDEYGRIEWDDPNIYSPKPVTSTETDYEALYNVILNALQEASITWRTDDRYAVMGKVIKTQVPDSIRDKIAKIVGLEIVKYREDPKNKELNYPMIIEALKLATPSTPLLEYEGDPWPEI